MRAKKEIEAMRDRLQLAKSTDTHQYAAQLHAMCVFEWILGNTDEFPTIKMLERNKK